METPGKHTASFKGFTAQHRLLSTILLVWVLCASVTSVAAEWSHYCSTERSERYMAHGRCGSQLAETLSIVCRVFGGYNSRRMRKRSTAATSGGGLSKGGPSHARGEVDSENSPFWSKSKAYSYLHIQKRVLVTRNGQTYRQGIVCECCMHKCGLGELYEYCADPAYAVTKRAATHGTSSKQRANGGQQVVPAAATGIGKRAARQSLTDLLAAAGLIPQITNETMPNSMDLHDLQKTLAALEAAQELELVRSGVAGGKGKDLGASRGAMGSIKGRFGLVSTDLHEGNVADVVPNDTEKSNTGGRNLQEGVPKTQEYTLLEQLIRLHIKQHRRRQGLTGTGATGSTEDSRDIPYGK